MGLILSDFLMVDLILNLSCQASMIIYAILVDQGTTLDTWSDAR